VERILIFEQARGNREKLERDVRSRLDAIGIRHVEFLYFIPGDVFSNPLPDTARAAFFTLGSMYDVEAACHFNKLRKRIPVVIVSDSEQYCQEGYNFAVYYLLRPFTWEDLGKALSKCGFWVPRAN